MSAANAVTREMVEVFRTGFQAAKGMNGLILADAYIRAGLAAVLELAASPTAQPDGEPDMEMTPEIVGKLQAMCDAVPDTDRATEMLAEARAALHKVSPPHDPASTNPLYYPLLFLCESVAPVLAWLDEDDAAARSLAGERTNG